MRRFVPLLALLLGACAPYYTTHIDPSMQGQKLSAAPVAVLPISGLDYRPPMGCMAPEPDPYAPQQWERRWNERLAEGVSHYQRGDFAGVHLAPASSSDVTDEREVAW